MSSLKKRFASVYFAQKGVVGLQFALSQLVKPYMLFSKDVLDLSLCQLASRSFWFCSFSLKRIDANDVIAFLLYKIGKLCMPKPRLFLGSFANMAKASLLT